MSGSHLDQIQGYEWPKSVELSVEILKPKHVSNASLQLVTEAVDAEPKAGGSIRVRVSNAAIDWIWSANLDPIGTHVWIY